jgi:TrpR-related protein YerC/YecD
MEYTGKLKNPVNDRFFEGLLKMENLEDCYRVFEDLCTSKEVSAISQRLQVAEQLKDGRNYKSITAETGASSATISRVFRSMQETKGGYEILLGEKVSNDT